MACNILHSSTRPDLLTRYLANRTTCLAKIPLHSAGRPIPASTAVWTRPGPITSRNCLIIQTIFPCSPRVSALTMTPLLRSELKSRLAPTSIVGAAACFTATMPLSQPLASLSDSRASLGPVRSSSMRIGLCWVQHATTSMLENSTRQELGLAMSTIAILGLNYVTNYTYSGNVQANHTVMLQLSLRTLGGTSVSQGVGRPASN